jgi:hypothetical protein
MREGLRMNYLMLNVLALQSPALFLNGSEIHVCIPDHLVFVFACLRSVSCVLIVSYVGWPIIDSSFLVSLTFIYQLIEFLKLIQ